MTREDAVWCVLGILDGSRTDPKRVSTTVNNSTRAFGRDGIYVTDPVLTHGTDTSFTPGISERRSGTTTFLHSGLKNADAQSSTAQAITATRTYDAFGMIRSSTGTWRGPFGYAGGFGYQEDASGLRLLGHRYYDASTGRFLTRDPIKDGRNWYAYGAGEANPLTGVDPSGTVWYYNQVTGQFVWVPDNFGISPGPGLPPVPIPIPIPQTGFSGASGRYRNNPRFENVKNRGVIPIGRYHNDGFKTRRRSKPNKNGIPFPNVWLRPYKENRMHNRDGFLIHHGDPNEDPLQGCICFPPPNRDLIKLIGDSREDIIVWR